ncbi:MAG: DUF1652 domain-containing protein [Pseudomonas sp.]|uniref:DUF1652 domain-containing protein n=1 Tax=Pseudomonas sp. TaxID=306 RepID=UPI003396EC66
MSRMSFPSACQRLRTHFYPIGFDATLDSPGSMAVRLFVVGTGETLLSIAGIACSHSLTEAQVERIIVAIEAAIDSAVCPPAQVTRQAQRA